MKTDNAHFLTQRREEAKAQTTRFGARAVTRPQRMADEYGVRKARRFTICGVLRAGTARAPFFASLLLCAIALNPLSVCAVTNDLSGLLQRGLFEEEANRNLDAAAQAYTTVSAQFDKDRKLAATAIFRLGEIYRKQGKTNEAVGQYERIVREFADQDTLFTLSRQNVAGLGANRNPANSPSAQRGVVSSTFEGRILGHLKKLSRAELRDVLPGVSADAELTQLLIELNTADKNHAEKVSELGPNHPQIMKIKSVRELLDKKIESRMDGIIRGMELKMAAAEDTGEVAKPGKKPDVDANGNLTKEDDEIRRIQTMIQNSPDLINGSAEGESPLFKAAGAGWTRVVNFLLDNGANVNKPSGTQTPLHQAVRNGNKAMVELLLKRGADMNAKDAWGGTALHAAAQSGFLSIAEVLVKHKADLNARNNQGEQSPLHLAAQNGHAALVSFLLANGDDVNRKNASGETPLHTVAVYGRDGVIERLLKSGADVNATDNDGETPLMNAADQGHSVSVKALLAAKANPDLVTKKGRTALSLAVGRGHSEVVKQLLDAKADVNACTAESPLLLAVRADNLALAETLLRAGANPNQETECDILRSSGSLTSNFIPAGNRAKQTPLQAAVLEERHAAVKLLLQFNGDPHAKTSDGSPLFLATLQNPTALKAFLEAGADANGKDGKGQCALLVAASSANPSAIELLLAHGADVNARGEYDVTSLHWAATKGVVKSVELLLARKPDLQAKTKAGDTPLHWAVGSGWKQIVELLLTHGADPNVRNNSGITPLDKTKPTPGAPETVQRLTQPDSPQSWTKPSELAQLLRKHGALDDLPDFKSISVSRASSGFRATVFTLGTNEWSEYTLIELLAKQLLLISTKLNGIPSTSTDARTGFWNDNSIRYPDLSRITIHRPAKAGNNRKQIPVNLAELVKTKGEKGGVMLQPGDVVEVPESDHPVSDSWSGLAMPDMEALIEATAKTVTLIVGGKSNELRLATMAASVPNYGPDYVRIIPASFMIRSALDQSKLVRFSSDLTRVKVSRKVGPNGKPVEWVVDCSGTGNSFPDLWLRGGDVIEVPDKP